MRCGEIVEAVVEDIEGRQEEQKVERQLNEAAGIRMGQPRDAGLSFNFFNYVSSHSSLNMSRN